MKELKVDVRRYVSLILVVLMGLLPLGAAKNSEQENIAEMQGLMAKPYSELFSSIGERYQTDEKAWLKLKKMLQDEDAKEIGAFDTKIEQLKAERTVLREERKRFNNELLKLKAQYDRLEEKRDEAKKKGEDVSAFEKEVLELEDAANKPTAKSNELKIKLDGDTRFDLGVAYERIEDLEDALKSGGQSEAERQRVSAEIVRIQSEVAAKAGLNRQIKIVQREKYLAEAKNSHKFAKLNSLQSWPSRLKKIRDTIIAGKQTERRWGNVEEIGDLEKRTMRKVHVGKILPGFVSEKSELQLGQQVAQEILRQVKIHKDDVITEYVNRVGQNIVNNSDKWCPFTFYTIADPPGQHAINAMALPGGQVFVNDSLVLAMESEDELAAVLAHEVAHVTSRHYAKVASKMQWMQIASMAAYFVGVIGNLGMQGVGMLENVAAIGITRASEAEADQLGAQYLWKAGYDPRALGRSFDRLLKHQRLGGSAFWQTHPLLDNRIEHVEEEARYLAPQSQYRVGNDEYAEVQKAIRAARVGINKERKEEKDKERKKSLKRDGEGGNEPETPVLRRRAPTGKIPQEDPNKPSAESPDNDSDRPVLMRKDPKPEDPPKTEAPKLEEKKPEKKKSEEPKNPVLPLTR